MSMFRTILLLSVMVVCLTGTMVQSQDASTHQVETATGPEGLLELEQQGKVTVRALRAWGRLPDTYVKLAQQLRQEAGLDLLGADPVQVAAWIGRAEAGEEALAKHLDELKKLAQFMEGGEHLDWTPAPEGASMPAGTLVRSGGVRWTQTADGPVEAPGATAQAEPVQAEPVQAEPVEPVQAEPVQARARSGRACSARARSGRARSGRARSGRACSGRRSLRSRPRCPRQRRAMRGRRTEWSFPSTIRSRARTGSN
jgi:hypothetical protein